MSELWQRLKRRWQERGTWTVTELSDGRAVIAYPKHMTPGEAAAFKAGFAAGVLQANREKEPRENDD